VIAEFLVVSGWTIAGAVMLHSVGLRDWSVWPLGLVTGLALYFSLGALQVATPLPDHPAVAYAGTLAAAAAFACWRAPRLRDALPHWRSGAVAGAGIAAVVMVTRTVHIVRWHVDTFEYFKVAALMTQGHLDDGTFIDALDKRLLGVPMMHAPALWWDEWYLRSVTPLVGIACLTIVVWVVHQGVRGSLGQRLGWVVPVLAGLALALTNRFQFHALYLNGHLLAATFLVALVGCAWLYLDSAGVPEPALIAVVMAASAGLVVTRPEGGLLAGLALVSFVVSDGVTRRHRALTLLALGLAVSTWHGYAAVAQARLFDHTPATSLAYAVVGAGVVAVGLLVAAGWSTPLVPWLPGAFEASLWLGLLALVVHDAEIFLESAPAILAMYTPIETAWGGSLFAFYAASLLVLWRMRFIHQRVLRYPWSTFVVLALVLAYARDGRYHGGSFDSLIRMFIEVVPVMVVFIAIGMVRGVPRDVGSASATVVAAPSRA